MYPRCTLLASLALLCAGTALADTIFLNNGVKIDGVIKQREGYIEVNAGGNTVFYREAEIEGIEENEKTGKVDLAEVQARWEVEEAALVAETGLTAEQRNRVRELLGELAKDPAARMDAREKLAALHAEADVYRYLHMLLSDASHFQVPHMLEAMLYLDAGRAVKELRVATQHNYYEARAKAIELLGGLGNKESVPLIARGLADISLDVRIQAAYALARTESREATPALIELLTHPDLRMSNASREALAVLWKDKVGDTVPETVDAWNAIWTENKASVSEPIQLALLQPLVTKEEEFVNE